MLSCRGLVPFSSMVYAPGFCRNYNVRGVFRSHELRHTFATTALEHGMDTKTLSTIIGHVSASTTLDIYAHVTDEMRRTAAVKIDRGISKTEPQKTTDSATPQKASPIHLPAVQGPAAQTRHRLRLTGQRQALGRPLLPHLAGRQKASAQCLRPQQRGVRTVAGRNDTRSKSGDRR